VFYGAGEGAESSHHVHVSTCGHTHQPCSPGESSVPDTFYCVVGALLLLLHHWYPHLLHTLTFPDTHTVLLPLSSVLSTRCTAQAASGVTCTVLS
jgi:hypothetical protein